MSEDFEKWWLNQTETEKSVEFDSILELCKYVSNNTWNHQQAKLDAQAEELAALRGFADDVKFEMTVDYDEQDFISIFKKWGLITVDGNPTPLLNGIRK